MHVIQQIRERVANPINVIPIRSTTSTSNPAYIFMDGKNPWSATTATRQNVLTATDTLAGAFDSAATS